MFSEARKSLRRLSLAPSHGPTKDATKTPPPAPEIKPDGPPAPLKRRTSIIQDMRSQLQPRLSLFEIHVNPVIKPPLRPITKPRAFRLGNSISLFLDCFESYCTASGLTSAQRVSLLLSQLDPYSSKVLVEYSKWKFDRELRVTEWQYTQLCDVLLECLDEKHLIAHIEDVHGNKVTSVT